MPHNTTNLWHYVALCGAICGIMWHYVEWDFNFIIYENYGSWQKWGATGLQAPLSPRKTFLAFSSISLFPQNEMVFSLTLSPGLPNQQGRQTFQSEGASFVQSCSIPCLMLTSLTTMMRQEISNHFQVLLIDWSCINISMNIIYCCKLQLNEFILGLWISKI